MTQHLPLTLSFTEGATVYGDYWASYLRIVPWGAAQTISGYFAGASLCSLNLGYLTAHQGVSFTNHNTLVADSLGCTVWNDYEQLSGTVRMAFRLATVSGVATEDSARVLGACGRVQGGARDDTIDVERHSSVTGYFLLWLNSLASGMTWVLVRVVSGAVTVLASEFVPGSSLAYLTNDRVCELSIRNSGGSPLITARTGFGVASTTLFGGPFSDTDPAKIMTAGRFGKLFGRDRQEAGSTNTAIVCQYFELLDGLGASVLRDEWSRNPGEFSSGISFQANYTDGSGIGGRAAQCLHLGDVFGFQFNGNPLNVTHPFRRRTFPRNIGLGRIFFGDTGGNPSAPAHVASFGAEPANYFQAGRPILIQTYRRPCSQSFRRKLTTRWHWTHFPPGDATPVTTPASGIVSVEMGTMWPLSGDDLPGFVFQYRASNQGWRIFSRTGRNSALELQNAPFNLSNPLSPPNDWGDELGNPPTPITIETDFRVTGSTPNREMVVVFYVNGTPVPLSGGVDGLLGWSLDGDGFTQRGLESVMGTPTFNGQANAARWEFLDFIHTTVSQVYITLDDWADVATFDSCGTNLTAHPAAFACAAPQVSVALSALPVILTALPATFALSAPRPVVALAGASALAVRPAAFALAVPRVQVQLGETARFPAGQTKFGGTVAGCTRYGGAVAGTVMWGW